MNNNESSQEGKVVLLYDNTFCRRFLRTQHRDLSTTELLEKMKSGELGYAFQAYEKSANGSKT